MRLAFQDPANVIAGRVYDRVRDAFGELATTGAYPALWREVLARSTEPELPPGDVVSPPVSLLGDRAALEPLLRAEPLSPSLEPSDGGYAIDLPPAPLDELDAFAARLDGTERRALDVLLYRGLTPHASLPTWPLDAMFDAAEIRWLERARPNPRRAAPRRLRLARGERFDPSGYAYAIVKFTRLCNLRCTYCHDWRDGPGQTMDFETQATLFEKLLGAADHDTVDVLWHGGEPLVLGRKSFLRILALQGLFRRPGQVVRNGLQTNAVLVDPRWARFLARYGFRAGVSLDGPASVHDRVRLHVNGRGSSKEALRGFHLLREHGVDAGVLVVVTDAVLRLGARKLLEFVRAEGIDRVGLLPERPDPRTARAGPSPIDRAEYWGFVLEMHRLRRVVPGPPLAIREVDALARAVAGQMPGHCELHGNCAGGFYTIEPDGSVGQCDKFVDTPHYALGSLGDGGFDELRTGEAVSRLRAAEAEEDRAMQSCPHHARCRGWCPHERMVAGGPDRRSAPCCGLAPVFDALLADAAERRPLEAR